MDPFTATIVSGFIAVTLFLVTIFNFAKMGRDMFSNRRSFEESSKSFGNGFAIHVIVGGLASLATLSFIASFVWLMVTKFA